MEVALIPIADLTKCKILLRTVRVHTVSYLELRDSMQHNGLWQPLLVRLNPRITPTYEVVDGNYRYTIAKELGLKSLPCLIRDIPDDQVILIQIQANAVRAETAPIEFARQLSKIMKVRPDLTAPRLALLLNKNQAWLRKMLGLKKLISEAKLMLNRGEIPLESAMLISQFPAALQEEYLCSACALLVRDFIPYAKQQLRAYKTAARIGSIEAYIGRLTKPVPWLRSMRDLKAELATGTAGREVLAAEEICTPMDGWAACMKWILHLDAASVEKHKNDVIKREKTLAERTEKRKKQRCALEHENLKLET